ncbi:MAG: hypothetical protein Q8P18_21400 [Pseudomonadota bacterium]|nr:hypothetical protein [Pseudomonadota bacterium]
MYFTPSEIAENDRLAAEGQGVWVPQDSMQAVRDGGIRREVEHGHRIPTPSKLVYEVWAGHPGHTYVGDEELKGLAAGDFKRLVRRRGRMHEEPLRTEKLRERVEHQRVVVHE